MAWVPLAAAAINAAGQKAAAAPSSASQYSELSTGIDFSDFTVATSGSRAEGSSDSDSQTPNWLILAGMVLAAVVAVKWLKNK